MIVEYFGPAGAGKTTLARAAAQALGQSERAVHLASSARPAEETRATLFAGAARIRKALDLARPHAATSIRYGTASLFGPLLKPANKLWRLRFLRYLSRLDDLWDKAKSSRDVIIFDQGYISALGSAFLRNQACTRDELVQVLRQLPVADVTIHVSGPSELIEQRLTARLAAQSWIERLLELNPNEAWRQPHVFATLAALLADHDRAPATLSSANADELSSSVREIIRLLDQADSGTTALPDASQIAGDKALQVATGARVI